MHDYLNYFILIHVIFGAISLVFGLMALLAQKGGKAHRISGKIYVVAMTGVFITGTLVAGIKFNRFLFLIAFLSYYSVFSGVRILKLKQLHLKQKPKWYDWFAGILNGIANLSFIIVGIYYGIKNGFDSGAALLSIGFGIGGILLSYTNLLPFVKRPKEPYHWYLSHIGNMTGGYIATLTAFLSTMVTRFDLMNAYFAFALPSLIGIPLLIWFQVRIKKQYNTANIK